MQKERIYCCMYQMKTASTSYPDFAKADYGSITAYLDSIDWLLLQSNCSHVENLWSEISNFMMMCIGKFVPTRTSNVERKFKYPKHI